MSDLQSAKDLVRRYFAALDEGAVAAAKTYFSPDAIWRGYHPFHEIHDPVEVAKRFWEPLQNSLRRMQRRLDIFMAGENQLDAGGVWVASMGHLMGLFDEPWLNIPPTNKIAMLRYAEFHRVEGDKITDTAMFFDIPHLAAQAGLRLFASQTGAHLVHPAPMTHTGVMFDAQNPEEGLKTKAAIDFMINDIRDWTGREELGLEIELPRSWNDDMIWWGPTGIGATYTIERYIKQHAGPFRDGLADRTFNGHIARIAEGEFGGFFGWPNLTLKPSGGFMGMPASDKASDMRVIDMYRRSGDKLTENWIFIDLLHFWNQQGADILGRIPHMRG
ncbi:nuclear transport factor 2 family protein [Phaeobacter piscinae]|uniref:nuclear transport factor 2 family protein n=1 Tax=Phaeobacter piscinae TaxID=1580596 RepID=UPI0005908399|nr:nuclear transport factor 2 family protein [Phaeobacter piscinae]UTS82607.1 hypothetical protein OL67_003717 [Phaeobacter piscinae]